jgi:hypothetical protein
MPSADAIRKAGLDVSYDQAPAVLIKRKHHVETPTHGGQSAEGFMNRALQRLLIKDLQFDVAQDLDIAALLGQDMTPRETAELVRGMEQMLERTVNMGLRKEFGEWSARFDDVLNNLAADQLQLHKFK